MSTHGNAKSAFLMMSAAFSLSLFLHFPKSARAQNKVEALQPRSFVDRMIHSVCRPNSADIKEDKLLIKSVDKTRRLSMLNFDIARIRIRLIGCLRKETLQVFRLAGIAPVDHHSYRSDIV